MKLAAMAAAIRVRSLLVMIGILSLFSIQVDARADDKCADDPKTTLGIFGRYTALDSDIAVDDMLGLGGRFGWWFARDWAIEADLSYNHDSEDGPDLTMVPLHIRLVRQWHTSESLRFHAGAGYVHTVYSGEPDEPPPPTEPFEYDAKDDGLSLMLGLEQDLGSAVAIRVDGVADGNFGGELSQHDGADWHAALEFGFVFGFGRRNEGKSAAAAAAPVVLFPEGKTEVILEGVNFELDQAVLLPESRNVLSRVATSLRENPGIRVEVQGHTDNTGTPEHNRELSLARANAVRDYLIDHGVTPDRLTAYGYGQERPIATNDTDAGRALNRRVELRRLN